MNDLNKIQYIAKKINLSLKEKAEIRDDILNFIKTHPAKGTFASRHISIWSRLNLLNNFSLKPIPAFLSILLISGVFGSVSLAAERALPGDLLYPVKVGINEEVLMAISFSEEAKTKWEVRRFERRLEEAERLAHKKEFDAEARLNIEKNFVAHAERVERRIAEFEEKGNVQKAADLSLNFEVSLDAHEKILEKLDGEEVNKFLPKVREKKDGAKLLRVKSESRISEKSSIQGFNEEKKENRGHKNQD